MSPILGPDTKAIMRIATELTEQVRRVADALTTPVTTPRLLACGLCYEEHGEEVHPHPECPIGTAERPSALIEQVADAIEHALLAAVADREIRQTLARTAANRVVDVLRPGAEITATLARDSEATVQRVIDLYEQWVKAGPPKLGTPIAREWDRRLIELSTAINGPVDQPRNSS
ncbi:hypothetical protein [Streptomyces cadmiisoli]|uniref:hypothetical protein n=1 Tax=Streptomyces cadmiisoli TaxID=2184053 RepID=UPI003D73983D